MKKLFSSAVLAGVITTQLLPLSHAANVEIRLPERFRLLTDQLFDLRVEAADLADINADLLVKVNGANARGFLGTPEITTNNDSNPGSLDKAWTFHSIPGRITEKEAAARDDRSKLLSLNPAVGGA